MKKKYLIAAIILIFIVSVGVRYLPVFHKGFSYSVAYSNLILARNLNLTGEYKIDNEKNVILSSEIVKEKGIQSKFGNKLTPILYGKVFDVFGFNQNIPLWASLILYGVVSVLLFLLILKLFNIWVALIFSGIDIFIPMVLGMATRTGFYEWAVLFFSIALLFYLYRKKAGWLSLFCAGLFFGLASLAVNAFGFSFIPFLIYDFWRSRSIKRAVIFALSFFLLWGLYLGPNFIRERSLDNAYLSSQETTGAYMHLFPDPYTWHFERDDYVEKIKGTRNSQYNEFLTKYKYSISLKNKALMYFDSFASYPKGFFAQTVLGGPILVLFLLVGGIYLYRKKKYLMRLFLVWGILWYLLLAIFKTNRWGHFIELQLPLILLISLGIYWLTQLIRKQNIKERFKYLLIVGIFLTLLLHLIQSDKWMFHENYENSQTEKALILVGSIERARERINKKTDIIAVGAPNPATSLLNWHTDFNFVYFDSATVEKLLKEDKLQWAFDQFGVTKVIGYGAGLMENIGEKTNVDLIY